MWASLIGGAFGAIKAFFSWLGVFQQDLHDTKEKNAGRAEVAAEELKKIEEARREREKLDREVAGRTDAQLDADLDKWMRD